MSGQERAELAGAASELVRQASREGRLLSQEELLAGLAAGGFWPPGQGPGDDAGPAPALGEAEASAALAGLLAGQPGLDSFPGLAGQRIYHAPDLLSRTYARILDRKGSALVLMAEEVRANSRDYPRPLPLELFEAPPFGLTPPEIEQALRGMAAQPAYQDITFTATDSGALYLFSTRHLERRHAAFLAQRAEDLALNP